jgi:hypothetical protein
MCGRRVEGGNTTAERKEGRAWPKDRLQHVMKTK